MNFGAPEWFFLLPAIVAAGWRWRSLRLHEPLRALAALLLVFILAQPRLRLASGGLDLWVLVDRSDSNARLMAQQSREIEAILTRSRGSEDRIFYVDYAGEVARREIGDPVFEGQTFQTKTGNAVQYTLGELDRARANRLLVLTDGFSTEPLGAAAELVLRAGVPLDYRILGESAAGDWRVAGVNVAPRVLSGESFLVEVEITGPGEESVPWEVMRSGRVAASGVAKLSGGVARVQLTDRVTAGGAVKYEARVKPESDSHPENNVAAAWVEVASGPRVLLITNYPDDPLVPLLQAQGLAVDKVDDPRALDAGSLTGVRTVVINNVLASRIPPQFLAGLEFFVMQQGGGLLMAGGRNSFGSGGYFSSPIDPLLPVSMEQRAEQRKTAVSMVVTMDRSGSMGGITPTGQRKMDLANSGAARAIELLGDADMVSVYATDGTAHQIVGLSEVGPQRQNLINQARSVTTAGGGIVVMAALQAAWDELKASNSATRHIVLLADANDSGQALFDYASLVKQIRADNITITAIGLGTEFDRWAYVLRDVGELGGGRVFFTSDASDLPAVFAQETVSVARSTFVGDPTPTAGLPGWSEIALRPPNWLREVDGYNLSYLKPEATGSLMTTDENKAPLVASWARGAGRVAAVSFPLGGDHSARTRAWEGYGDFVQTLTRWLGGEDAPPGMALRSSVEGDQLTLDLFYDETQQGAIAESPPAAMLAETVEAQTALNQRALTWEKLEPGRFRATTTLSPGRVVKGAVRVGKVAMPFGPITVAGSAEWSFDRTRLAELRDLSARSGGAERLDLAQIWKAPRPITWRDVRGWLLIAWLVLLVTDAALTRLGISLVPRRWRPVTPAAPQGPATAAPAVAEVKA